MKRLLLFGLLHACAWGTDIPCGFGESRVFNDAVTAIVDFARHVTKVIVDGFIGLDEVIAIDMVRLK